MRALVITGPREATVQEVEAPAAGRGDLVVDVERVGLCGTDVELFTGEMQYLHDGRARYPLRIGHEWTGTVVSVGEAVDAGWIGRRVTGDTMLGCGGCPRCLDGRQHVCDAREELGFYGRPGALGEQVAVPARSVYALPASLDPVAGAMVEPGGNALRAVWGADLRAGDRLLVLGPGTVGLLVGMFARAAGAEVHLMGLPDGSLDVARGLGFEHTWTEGELPELPFDAVVDASNAAHLPARALELVEPGKRVVYIGLAGTPSLIDTRSLALKDVTAVGILSASPGLKGAIERYASGAVDPRPLVAATVGLDEAASVLAGQRPSGSGRGPKVHVDPRR